MKNRLLLLVLSVLRIVENYFNVYLTFVARPKKIEKVLIASNAVKNLPKSAVVMQGPIVIEDDFTINTCKLYKRLFPDSIIILSTWNDEARTVLDTIKQLGVKVVLNEPPAPPEGSYTVNLQLVSSLSGIKLAKKLGCVYVLKVRTDQRLYGASLMPFLISVVNAYPPSKGFKQKYRIVVPSMYSFKYRLYSITDMTVFSHIDEMIRYFGAPLDKRPLNDKRKYEQLTNIKEIAEYRVGEMYFSTEYLKLIGKKLAWTVKDYWETLRDNFVVVEQSVFDIYWKKYNSYQEYKHPQYLATTNKAELTYKDWLTIYQNLDSLKIPEHTQQLGFDEQIT